MRTLRVTGANFQGTPVSLPIDTLGAAINMVCVLSERRMNRLTNPALSAGLPPFLTKGAGMFSGLMLSQYTADMQIVEQRILSNPAFIQSIPAAADQEDFVSMGMNTALKTRTILDNAHGILGIELMAAALVVAANPDLHRAGCVDQPLPRRTIKHAAVVVFTPVLVAVGVRVEVNQGHLPVGARMTAQQGQGDEVVASEAHQRLARTGNPRRMLLYG